MAENITTAAPVLNTTTPHALTLAEKITEEGIRLDVTVWLVICCIFTFFFIIIVASICMHWMELRRFGIRGEFVLLPPGPVPGCVTVVSSSQPHTRLIDHYHLQACYGPSTRCDEDSQVSRCFSFPTLTRQPKDTLPRSR
ncbi:uncharacterized protein LOC126985842 [Eriocheir sinensis]|uniref:uncharacterized protein LOC126985842 n=1 Tax=Eriocheir sinensis TaxID=95602 RepID=UPI0021C9600C|nr:uncharacterized protein LOC126985842 [Eriocheir sinensis]XP_050697254.1 uncharacterized protein LOC126985842 [Eriocheir sinensis]XP_050697255.1 uncharacterized protein LOC126985842 [Eriocheir sinensis]